MAEKKSNRKKENGTTPERVPSLPDDRKRFGAVAFFDSQSEIDEDGEKTELSLDALREAFADAQRGGIATKPTPDFEEPGDNTEEASEDAGDAEERVIALNPAMILEAMLFVGNRENRPLTPQQAAERMRNVTEEEITAAVDELNRTYNRLGCPYHIVANRDAYKMELRQEFEAIRENFYGKVREATLSQRAIDTLAIVAYCQPITAEEVQQWRKEPVVATLSQLVRRGLLSTERQTRDKKKIVLYRTTERFLELFSLDSLDDLPVFEEIDNTAERR